MTFRKSHLSLVAALTFVSSVSAFAAGYEKSVFWSGRYAGIGGAATAIVGDSQALYFNPAGLASAKGIEFTAQFSPTFSQFKGPISTNTVLEGDRLFSPVGGAFVSYNVMDRLGIGAGVYVAGGTNAEFHGVAFPDARYPPGAGTFSNFTPDFKAKLNVTEISAGAGYGITDDLRIGAAWRMSLVKAELASAAYNTTGAPKIVALNLTDLKNTRYNGLRLGAQYAPKDGCWGVGADWRSPVRFIAKGTLSGKAEAPAAGIATPTDVTINKSAEAASEFPMQVSLGGYVALMDKKLRIMPEYTWTRYAVNRALDLSGSFTLPGALAAGGVQEVSDIPQNWNNQSNYRLGAEYMMSDRLALRAGYVLTTQVTPKDKARATFASPGFGHTMTLGAGTAVMDNKLGIDLALEYSLASGDGEGTLSSTGTPLNTGKFSTNVFVAHTGVSYKF